MELMKGSLNTFLNAFTYPDRTCYPVASCNLQVGNRGALICHPHIVHMCSACCGRCSPTTRCSVMPSTLPPLRLRMMSHLLTELRGGLCMRQLKTDNRICVP